MAENCQFLGLTMIEWWELIYYIAFIILTAIIVVYAIKTYRLQSKQSSELLCKLSESFVGTGSGQIILEIYNHGNIVIKDIGVTVGERAYGSIPFLKPEESYLIPVGFIIQIGDKRILMSPQSGIELSGESLLVKLLVSGNEQSYDLGLSILRKSAPVHNPIATELGDLKKTMDGVSSNIKELAKKAGKK